jgi:hypothetical protein
MSLVNKNEIETIVTTLNNFPSEEKLSQDFNRLKKKLYLGEVCVIIESTVASFYNLSTSEPIKNSVVIFWESHTKSSNDKIQSTIDLIPKKFDLGTCESYEVCTGYLSLYNYLAKPNERSQIEELEEAIVKDEEDQEEENYISPYESLSDILETMRYNNKEVNVEIQYERRY